MKNLIYVPIGLFYFIPLIGPFLGAFLLYHWLRFQGWSDEEFVRQLTTNGSKHGWWISCLMWSVMLDIVPKTKA